MGGCGSINYKGDGNCDDQNNNEGCDCDCGDCCAKTAKNGKVKKNYCSECKCIDPDNQGESAPGCGSIKYKGDGNCDDDNNNEGCDYDGGDCCAKTVKSGVVKKQYCKQCKCVDPKNQSPAVSTCALPKYKGDGNCDDDNNNEACDYDGGDCCAKTVKGGVVKKIYCKKCKCVDPKHQSPAVSICALPKYKGDGNCDDDNNN